MSQLHKQEKHYDITIHKEPCSIMKKKTNRAHRYWIRDIENLDVAKDIAYTQQKLWNCCHKLKYVLVRKCRRCMKFSNNKYQVKA